MTVADMQQSIRSQLNDLRALDRIVNSFEFLQCLRLDPNNPRLESAIFSGDLEAVREWMDNVVRDEFCELSMRQLRALASQCGIKEYTKLSKDELLIELVQVRINASQQVKNNACGMPHQANGTQTIS